MSPSRLSRTSTPSKSKPITQEDSDEQSSVQKLTHRSPLDKLNLSKGSDEIYHWIHQEIEGNRGVELQGTLNPDVLMNLFHKQAGGWRRIAKVHFQSVVRSTTSVLKKILEETECDPVTRRRILPLILAASEAQEMEKVGLLDERMDAITSKHLQTNNSAFLENVAKARLQRFHMALHRYQQATSTQRGGDNNQSKLIIDMRNTAALFSELHMSSARNLENDIHDTLKAYYEIARDDFIEFVTQLVVEKFVDNERGPVLLFSPTYITSLSDEAITDLAVEDEAVLRDMAEKEETLARLKRAEKIALKYA